MITLPPPGQSGGLKTVGKGKKIKLPSLASRMPQPQAKVIKPSFEMRNFPETLKTLSDIQTNPFSVGQKKNPVKSFLGGIKDSATNFVSKAKNLLTNKDPSSAGGYGKDLELISATANLVLSPITSLFTAANDVPVLGTVSRLASLPFSLAGEGASGLSSKALDKVPDNILPKEAKDKIRPGLQEISALAAQLAIGKAGELAVKKADLTKRFGAKDAETIINKAHEVAGVEAPQTKKITLPPPETRQALKTAPGEAIVPKTIEPVAPVQKVSKAASDINKNLVSQGFEELPTDLLAKYDPITKADQIQKVSELLTAEPVKARDMALGREPITGDINSQVIFNAVKNKAIAESDVATLRDLASSPVAQERSLAAQSLGASGFDNAFPQDPVRAMQDISQARQQNARIKDVPKEKKAVKESIKKEIKKPSKEDWSSFVDSLVC